MSISPHKKRAPGRPAFDPTEQERRQVEAMAGYGVPFEQIASITRGGIDLNTLKKHFRTELASGKAKANAKIGQRLYRKAEEGDTAALIWWTKAQMGWTDKTVVDHQSSDRSMSPAPNIDQSKLSLDTKRELLRAKRAAEFGGVA